MIEFDENMPFAECRGRDDGIYYMQDFRGYDQKKVYVCHLDAELKPRVEEPKKPVVKKKPVAKKKPAKKPAAKKPAKKSAYDQAEADKSTVLNAPGRTNSRPPSQRPVDGKGQETGPENVARAKAYAENGRPPKVSFEDKVDATDALLTETLDLED